MDTGTQTGGNPANGALCQDVEELCRLLSMGSNASDCIGHRSHEQWHEDIGAAIAAANETYDKKKEFVQNLARNFDGRPPI